MNSESFDHLERLQTIASPPLVDVPATLDQLARYFGTKKARHLLRVLTPKNGFRALQNALHVFASTSSGPEPGLARWNSPALWRNCYRNIQRLVFFAEAPYLGDQFGFDDAFGDAVFRVRAETGEVEEFADSLDAWAFRVMAGPNLSLGHDACIAWQKQNRELLVGEHLCRECLPDGTLGPLVPMAAAAAMRLRGRQAENRTHPRTK